MSFTRGVGHHFGAVIINPRAFQQLPIVETDLASSQTNQKALTERTLPPTHATLPSGLSDQRRPPDWAERHIILNPALIPHTHMIAAQSSLLNGAADDLEVRGDDAIKRLFAKYDTFLFDVSLLLSSCAALFSREARRGKPRLTD